MPLSILTNPAEDVTLGQIDAEIARLELQIISLRQLHNSRVPISRCPAEILSKIFLQGHQSEIESEVPFSRCLRTRLRISWVSHQWRNVALGYPALWNYIRVLHLQHMREDIPCIVDYVRQCLIRSRNTPLTIIYDGPHFSEALTLCSAQAHRIRNLLVHHNFHKPQNYPGDTWQKPAPILVHLEFLDVDLQDSLFRETYPQLRSLALHTCIDTWTSPIAKLVTLTTLKISHPDIEIPPEAIVRKLQALPALRFCSLHHCFDITPTVTTISPPILLPCLEYLSVVDSFTEVLLEFIRCLDLSHATVEVLHEELGEVEEEDFQELFESFKEHRNSFWGDVRIDNASIKFGDQRVLDSLTITISSMATSNHPITYGFLSQSEKFAFDPLVCASPFLLLGDVRHMSLNEVSAKGLNSLGPLPLLETLEIEKVESQAEFLDLSVASWVAFPSIRELRVEGVLYQGFDDYILRCGGKELGDSEDGDSVTTEAATP
ncbi:hypothetical protein BDN72DRAFT_662403 [Pluteus cervinus]|uniref:Uncharacterized protein n=1 Tax=Pluteus cervinus TaxID=181527 RepID=A0ACD3ASM8_9AGAR|nr:hypothetical protein BDN72DRAFT_662403 [Pluteus cervinus]